MLRLDTCPLPDPGPGELRVRLTHRPIHPADLSMVRGTYGRARDLPAVGGNEGLGTVEALGDGVPDTWLGQRVVKLGEAPTWQEAVLLRPDDVYPVPDTLPDPSAAQLFVNPLTAWLLHRAVSLGPGDVLVQTAGASAVARLATQLARQRGARVVAIVRRPDHAERLSALGADVVVADDNSPASRAALRESVGPSGAAAVFDPVAGETGALALSSLREGGTHIVYGALSRQPLPVSPAALIYRDATVRGVWRTQWASCASTADLVGALDELAELIADGTLALPVAATHDLSDVAEAVRQSLAPGRWGKVLLTG